MPKTAKKTKRKQPRRQDGNFKLLLIVVICLSLFGLVMVFSASHTTGLADNGDSYYYLKRQAKWLLGGFVAMLFIMIADYRSLRRFAIPIFFGSAGLLGLVLIPGVGITAGGASRWISIGGMQFQPSELAKFSLIIFAGSYLAKQRGNITEFADLFKPVLSGFLVMAALIMAQPDLGTTLILAAIIAVMLVVAGIRWLYLGFLAAGGVGAVVALIAFEGYRMARITSFINPWKDPQNSGFQIIQSLIALGSGKLFGVGLGMSKQKFFYLPAAHTDFIFAIIGEELGLIATLAVVVAFGLIALCGIRIAMSATTHFDRLVASGVTAMIVGQAVLNMGAVTGVLPITGVPLPLISSGGTSLLFTLAGVGLLLNISLHEKKDNKGIIDARNYFGGRNRRASVSRSGSGRGARVS